MISYYFWFLQIFPSVHLCTCENLSCCSIDQGREPRMGLSRQEAGFSHCLMTCLGVCVCVSLGAGSRFGRSLQWSPPECTPFSLAQIKERLLFILMVCRYHSSAAMHMLCRQKVPDPITHLSPFSLGIIVVGERWPFRNYWIPTSIRSRQQGQWGFDCLFQKIDIPLGCKTNKHQTTTTLQEA